MVLGRSEHDKHAHRDETHLSAALQRERFETSRHGVQFGVPRQAFTRAAAQMHAMEDALRHGKPATSTSAFSGASIAAPSTVTGGNWNSIGPVPMSEKANYTGVTVGGNVSMTGRLTSVAADSRGLIVTGAASGGLWLSTDDGNSFASVFDNQPTEAIGAVALDTTTNPSTIYAATGEGNTSIDSLYGAGIFKSTDLGQDWTQLAPGTFDVSGRNGAPPSFTALAIDPSNTKRIFAGVTSGFSANRADAGVPESDSSLAGLWFSSDGGNTWNHYAESVFGNCDVFGGVTAPCPADDVVIDPLNPQNVYVAIDSATIYYSHNGGVTFTAATFPGIHLSEGRQSLATGPIVPPPIGPSNNPPGGVVYAMIGASDGAEYIDMFESFNAGATWDPGTVLAPTVPFYTANGTTIDGTSKNNFSQSFYDQSLLVNPNDPSTVYFGGVGLYLSASNYGHSWNFLAPNGGIHSDVHSLFWNPHDNTILAATDGGLYRWNPKQGGSPTFVSLNQQINAGQIQGIGPHPINSSLLIAGFQDNGTQLYSGSGFGWATPDSETGDGGFAWYDPMDPNYLYHDFSTDDVNNELISASSDGGVTWCSAQTDSGPCAVFGTQWTPNLQALVNSVEDPGPVFYPALAVDPTTAHRVLFGAHSIYVSTDAMAHWAQQTNQDLTSDGGIMGETCTKPNCALEDLEFGPVDGQSGHPAWALAMSNLDGTVAFAVSNTTQSNVQLDANHSDGASWIDVTSGLQSAMLQTSSLGILSTQATSIAPDPTNSRVAWLGLSGFTSDTMVGHIYKTVDFGADWSEADAGLPDIPVLKVLVDATDNSGSCNGNPCSNSVFAGTDIGVFHSSDGGASWQPFSTGLPGVPVYE